MRVSSVELLVLKTCIACLGF